MAAFSVIYNLPLYYQVVLNLSAAKSGLRLIPNSIGSSLGSLFYGVLMAKTVFPYIVSLFIGLGTILLAWHVGLCISGCWDGNSSYVQCLHSRMGTFHMYCPCRDWFRRNYHRFINRLDLIGAYQRSFPAVFIINSRASDCNGDELSVP
jgi:hypothetical protein